MFGHFKGNAVLVSTDYGEISRLALAFVLARIGYIACYVADLATLRSLVWTVGMGCVVALHVNALMVG